MHHERQTNEVDQPIAATEPLTEAPAPWDPNERVGDVYQVDVPGDGTPPTVERLPEPDRPRIWVGSWLDYNNGVLYGDWIDADRDDDEIWSDIRRVLAMSPTTAQTGEPAEDWGIFDFDNFGPLGIAEQDDVSWISAVGRGIAQHGPAFAAYANVVQERSALGDFTDDYLGEYESAEDYAEQMIDDLGYRQQLEAQVPDYLQPYVRLDVSALARDLLLEGDIGICANPDAGVWIFRIQ